MPPASPNPSPEPDSKESARYSRKETKPDSKAEAEERRQRLMREYSRYGSVGVQFGAVLALFALAGYWVDEKLGSSPIFLVLGVLVGFGGGLVSLIRKIPVSSKGRHPRSKS
ncbi:MAG: AtpZ/AtpI family protein [Planctomycetes bacterium]|nr:AtpZ/AtpI family protein [Planctomycetota bacterium]